MEILFHEAGASCKILATTTVLVEFYVYTSNALANNVTWCHMGGSRRGRGSGPTPLTLNNHKNIGFLSNTGPNPLKSQSYEASTQYWAIIGPPAKRRVDDDPLLVLLGSSFYSSKTNKKNVRVGPLWIRACVRLDNVINLRQKSTAKTRCQFLISI